MEIAQILLNTRSIEMAICFLEITTIVNNESDGDGGAGEKKERKTKAEVIG